MSLLLGPDTTFIKMGSVLAVRAGHYIYQEGKFDCYYRQKQFLLGRKVSLLIAPDTTFIRMGSVLAIGTKHYIY